MREIRKIKGYKRLLSYDELILLFFAFAHSAIITMTMEARVVFFII
jgi:hypothetical protein